MQFPGTSESQIDKFMNDEVANGFEKKFSWRKRIPCISNRSDSIYEKLKEQLFRAISLTGKVL